MAKAAGKAWARRPTPPAAAADAWRVLIAAWNQHVCEGAGKGKAWKQACLLLLAIADEASSGVGYVPPEKTNDIRTFVLNEFVALQRGKNFLPYLPNSLALCVPPDVACVLPKALTPEVGCTLRSLSHNLALLPAAGAVRPEWYIAIDNRRAVGKENEQSPKGVAATPDPHSLNLLVIPFPYVVRGTDFRVSRPPEPAFDDSPKIDGYFEVQQGWLKHDGDPIDDNDFATFIIELVAVAQTEVGSIGGIVFPEGSLTPAR